MNKLLVQSESREGRGRFTPRWTRDARGLTLVEVAVAATIMAVVLLGFIGTLIRSLQVSDTARCRDQARAVLVSLASQFLRDEVLAADGTIRSLFVYTDSFVGAGITWQGVDCTTEAPLVVKLGGAGESIDLSLSRRTQGLNDITGATDNAVRGSAAGRLMQATFMTQYTYHGRVYTDTLVVVRKDEPR